MNRIFRTVALATVIAIGVSYAPAAKADAVRYVFIDEKAGLTSGSGLQVGISDWAPNTAYAAGAVVRNGGFLYKCSVAGTSAASPGPSPNTLTDNTATWVLGAAASQVTGVDAAQQHELGYIALGKDRSAGDYGVGEFIYVKFTGNVTPGDFVIIDRQGKTAVQAPTAAPGASKFSVIGVAMGNHPTAGTTADYGWVMIRGIHDQANVTAALTPGTLLSGGGASAGRANQAVANYIIDGSVVRSAGVVGTGTVELYWPSCSGR